MAASRKKSQQEKLVEAVDRLAVQTERLERAVTSLSGIVGRAVFPQEAMVELTGHLRALVYVLDTDKQFVHLLASARKQPPVPVEAPSSKGG